MKSSKTCWQSWSVSRLPALHCHADYSFTGGRSTLQHFVSLEMHPAATRECLAENLLAPKGSVQAFPEPCNSDSNRQPVHTAAILGRHDMRDKRRVRSHRWGRAPQLHHPTHSQRQCRSPAGICQCQRLLLSNHSHMMCRFRMCLPRYRCLCHRAGTPFRCTHNLNNRSTRGRRSRVPLASYSLRSKLD